MRFLAIFVFILLFLTSSFAKTNQLVARELNFQWKLTKKEKAVDQNLQNYFQKQQYQEALEYLVGEKNNISNLLFYHRQYLEILLLQEKEQELLNLATKWITKYNNNPDYLFLRAVFLYRLQHLLSAYEDFYLAYNKNNQTSQIVGFLYYYYKTIEHSNLPQASKLIDQILQIEPNNSYFWIEKTKLQIQARNLKAAYTSIQKAISLNPNKKYYNYLLELEKILNPDKYQNTLIDLIKKYPQDINYYRRYDNLHKTTNAKQKLESLLIGYLAKEKRACLTDFYLLLAKIQQELAKKESIKNYKKVISCHENPTATIMLADNLWRVGQKAESIVYFRELYDKQAQGVLMFYRLGTYYQAQNQPYTAEEFILSGLEYHPNNINLLWLYTTVLQTQRRYQEAIRAAAEILKIEKNHPALLSNIGYWHSILGNYNLAEKFLKQSLAIKNDDFTRYRIANIYYQQNNNDLALSYLKAEFQNKKLASFAYELKAKINFAKKQYATSLLDIQKSLSFLKNPEKQPTNFIKDLQIRNLVLLEKFELARAKIQSYKRQTKFTQRQTILLKLNAQKTTKSNLAAEIKNYLQQNEIDNFLLEIFFYLTKGANYLWNWNKQEAQVYQKILLLKLKDAELALAKLPKNSNRIYLNYLLGQAKWQDSSLLDASASGFWQNYYLSYESFKKNKIKQSSIFITKAILENPDFIWNHALLGRIYQRQKLHTKAVQSYKKFLVELPFNFSVLKMLATSYEAQQQDKQAEKIYLKIIKKNPKADLALNNLAWLYLTRIKSIENTKTALKLSQKAVAIKENSANLDTLAEAYYQNKNYKKALVLIEKSLLLDTQKLDHFKRQKEKFLEALQNKKIAP